MARPRVLRDIVLAVPPTVATFGILALVQHVAHERVLFAPLAVSAFLVYTDPHHGMNDLRPMVGGHLVALGLGCTAAAWLGGGYAAAALAMAATIVVLVLAGGIHPPAIATALAFGFVPFSRPAVGTFVACLAGLAVLVLVQRAAAHLVHGKQHRTGGRVR